MTWWQNLPKTKALTALGIILSASTGSIIGILVVNFAAQAIAAGFFLSLIFQLSAISLGALNGVIVFLQALKLAQKWPLENNGPFVFSPVTFLNDIKIALKNIDFEILKYASLIYVDYIDPSFRENLREQRVFRDNSFFSRMELHISNWFRGLARTATEDYVIPYSFRNYISCQIHMLNYEASLNNQLPAASEAQRNTLKQQEEEYYKNTSFVSDLTFSNKGFFETIGSTLYNEFEHPPAIRPAMS